MILRNVNQLRPGDVMIMRHPRYKQTEFLVASIGNAIIEDTMVVKVVTMVDEISPGPTICFQNNDLVQVTPE